MTRCLDERPDQTALELLVEFQARYPGRYDLRQLHTDIVMPELDGIEATRLISKSLPLTRVVILSMYSTTEHIFRALQAGAKGYLLKESAGAELVSAVRSIHAGRRFLSQKITESVVDDYVREHVATDPFGKLSSRERQICSSSPRAGAARTSVACFRYRRKPSIRIAAASCRSSTSTTSPRW
jgi:CheY-like chemotaxis protein